MVSWWEMMRDDPSPKSLGVAGKPFFLYPFLGFCTLLSILARGYYYGASDQNLYFPFVLHWNDPSLFPHDALLALSYARESITWRCIAWASRYLNLPALILMIYILVSFLLLLVVYKTALAWWRDPKAAWIAVFLWMPTYLVPGVANNTFDSYFTTRILGTLFGVLAIYFFLGNKRLRTTAALFLGMLFHIISLLPVGFGIGLWALLKRRWRFAAGLVAALTTASGLLFRLSFGAGFHHQMLAVYGGSWRHVVRQVDSGLFPAGWQVNSWIGLGIYILLFYGIYLARRFTTGVTLQERKLLVLNSGIVLLSGAGLIGSLLHVAIIVQLCLFRGYLFLMYTLALLLAGVAAKLLERQSPAAKLGGLWIAASWASGDWTLQLLILPVLLLLLNVAPLKAAALWTAKTRRRAFITLMAFVVACLGWQALWYYSVSLRLWYPDEGAFAKAAFITLLVFTLWRAKPALWRRFHTALLPAAFALILLLSPSGMMIRLFHNSRALRVIFGPAAAPRFAQCEAREKETEGRRRVAELVRRRVPRDAVVIVPPNWMDFRLLSLRSPFVTFKDSAPAEFNADYADEWTSRINAIHGYEPGRKSRDARLNLSRAELLSLAARYRSINLDFVVTTVRYDLPELGRAGRYRLYRIGGSDSSGGMGERSPTPSINAR